MPDTHVGNIRIVGRADELDAEQVAEAVGGRFWELMKAKIVGMIGDETRILRTSDDSTAIARAQGACAKLERVLELPDIIRKEVSERKRR